MNVLVPITLIGWLPLVALLFAWLPPRRAVIVAFLVAWLFLPMAGYQFTGLPNYTKMSATSFGVAFGLLVFHPLTVLRYRFAWIDTPMLIWCLCPLPTSIANGLGVYDGISTAVTQALTWGLPYIIGRICFRSLSDLRELAIGVLIGGLIYVPLCLFEIRMSPQLHDIVYGFKQHSWAQTRRFGGWRPTVFMQHGLMVGMWMCMTALLGASLWAGRALPKSLLGFPATTAIMILMGTAIWCRSIGAIILMVLGLCVLLLVRIGGSQALIWMLVAAAPTYSGVRMVGLWDGSGLVRAAQEWINADRAESLQFRIKNEDMLVERAMERPVFGWGGWSRSRVHDERGRDMSVTDGMWVIALGKHGLVGWISLSGALLLPTGLLLVRTKRNDWLRADTVPALSLALIVVLYWIDCVPNGMVNPVFTLIAGGLASVANGWRTVVASRIRPITVYKKDAIASAD